MTMLNDTTLTLGQRFRVARIAANLKQSELAATIGVARATLSLWENGETEPTASKLFALARATGQPLDWFAETTDQKVRGSSPFGRTLC
ncbi:transcriptional regulator with XRE-family HTH domain [Microbacterium proteolyticum]|uniref:helix-turn-helix domain-containing protein n=1 Tax=Microbacterium proteolyticum TaxID=1572644 RepID=UPI00278277D8|nr:helix-turn-helix transcriptional regulator [Microbacterium proteolyticum]MDQ1169574.1 transcriptional regulator with XRE-family HTH domain [Microbacterium proteolyticum]